MKGSVMADEAELQVSDQDMTVEETTADSQSEEQTQDSNAGSTEQTGESQAGSDTENAGSSDKEQSEAQDTKQESKPLSRRSAAYRIQELVKENNELKKQVRKPVQQDDWGEEPQEDDKPDIAALVAKEVEKRLNPVISESTKAADDAEINELFSGDRAGERSKYEPAIRDMWKLPQYKDVAAADLYKIASFHDAVATATARAIEDYKKAQKEARDSSASGTSNTSNRTGKGGKSVADMTDEEFLQHNERVKAGLA